MSEKFDLEAIATIKRLRSGQTIYLSLDTDKALFQAVDTDSGVVAPDFTVVANQPTITPSAKAVSGETVTLSDHHWKWNGAPLTFDGAAESDGFKAITAGTGKGLFKMNPDTGQLRIIGNLARKDNYSNDTLTYTGDYVIATSKMTGTLSKDMTVPIQKSGASSYVGMATPAQTVLDANTQSTTINTTLMYGTMVFNASDYSCKWYKGSRSNPLNGTGTTLTVDRDMVDGQTLFICDFIVNNGVVATDGCQLTDMGDEMMVRWQTSGDLSKGHPVTVKYTIVKTKTQTAVNVTRASWDYKIYRMTNSGLNDSAGDSDFKPVVEQSGLSGDSGNPGTLTVTVSTDDTEKGGLCESDVAAAAHVEFEATL